MIANHLLLALRRIRRHRTSSLINVAGLAVGLACCVTIVLYVTNELTYDSFHPGVGRIYRVSVHRKSGIGEFSLAETPGPLAPALAAGSPLVEKAARIIPPPENADHVLVVHGEKRFFEKRVWFVDQGIFEIFRIPVIQGDPPSAMARPYTALITEGTARKYFGREPAVGRTLQIEVDYDTGTTKLADFEVAGIVRNAPSNTHFKYDLLLSMPTFAANVPTLDEDWLNYHAKYTYLKLRPGVDPRGFEKQIGSLAASGIQKVKERYSRDGGSLEMEHILQPVTRIHMFSRLLREIDPPGNWTYVAVYSMIAFLILLIGVLNYSICPPPFPPSG